MNLYNVIYQLVCDNDCVIIPDFGGFVTNRFSADVDFSKQEFYPPSRKVAFNENLSLSDGMLINYISRTENVSWYEAERMVKLFVDDINEKLSNGKNLTFEGLGSFSKHTGNLIFVPSYANLLDESFGLTSFNFPMLPSDSKPFVKSAIIKGIPDKKGKKLHKGRAIAWSLTSAAVVGGMICMSLYMGWFDRIFGSDNDTNTMLSGFGVGVANTPEIVVDDQSDLGENEQDVNILDIQEPTYEDTEIKEDSDIYAESVADNTNVVESTNTVEPGKNIDFSVYIIAGCFANYSNAENVYNDLVSKGLSPQILPLHKGLHRVSVKGFYNTDDAYAELKVLKEQTGNDSLWVMKL